MKCPQCGFEVRDGTVFCTSCGNSLSGATSDSAESDIRKDEHGDVGDAGKSLGRRSRCRVIIVVCAVLLLVIVGVCGAFALRWFLLPQSVTYGSDSVVALAREARIVPHDAEGNPLEHYYVRILQAIDAQGNEVDTSDVRTIEVTGTGGFIVEDLIQDAPDATYYPQVVDDNEVVFDLPPIEVSDEGSAGTLIIEQGTTETPAVSEADRLYLHKLEDTIETWGEATVKTIPARNEYSLSATYICGAVYAELIDFGDGVERLVVAHLENEDNARQLFGMGGGVGVYRVEVWGYNSVSGTLDLLWDDYAGGSAWEGALGTEVALSFIDFVRSPDDGSLCLCVRDAMGSLGNINRTYYAISDAGEFEAVKVIECRIDETADEWESWYIDDVEVNEADYEAELARWGAEKCYLLANSGETVADAQTALRQPFAGDNLDDSAIIPVEDTAHVTQSTLDELRERVGESADGAEEGADAEDTATPSAFDRGSDELTDAALEQFESKLDELVDTYGTTGSYASQTTGSQAYAYAKGLCFARVVDFGDGVQRLITACCVSGSFSNPYDISPEEYQVEVWRYDEAEGKLVLDWRGNATSTNGGFPQLVLWTDESGKVYLQVPNAEGDSLTPVFAAPDASGKFGQFDVSAQDDIWVRQDSYMFLGVGDSNDQALDAGSSTTREGDMEYVGHGVSETIETASSALIDVVN